MPGITLNLPFLSEPLFIDLSYLIELSGHHPYYIMSRLILDGGWVILLCVIGWGIWKIYLMKIQRRFGKSLKWIILAIDVPKDTEQSPKAVEYIFAHLAGGYRGLVKKELYWEGQTQFYFSLEVVSIDGYVQFFIRTVDKLRDLVEAAIYSQYPDAEIAEVEDYTDGIPNIWPNDKTDFWGTEYVLAKKWPFPIRTWPMFEHTLSAELKDPMALLLESLSRLRKGEQIWLQIVVTPATDDWRREAEKTINKLIGRKTEAPKKGLVGQTADLPVNFTQEFLHTALTGTPLAGEGIKERDDSHLKMLGMTKGERDIVEGVQMKMSKPGFSTKIRFIYLAEKPVFTKGPRIALISGVLKQFASGTNHFRPFSKVTPKSDYFWQKHKIFEYLFAGFYTTKFTRQKHLFSAYKVRSNWRGAPSYILNIEELATLFHFPVRTVKSPLLKKTEAKRAEPPFRLPLERSRIPAGAPPLSKITRPPKSTLPIIEEEETTAAESNTKGKIPRNLPIG